MTFGASWGARLAHLSRCFKCPYVDFQSPDMFWSTGSVLKGFKGEKVFAFLLYLLSIQFSSHSCPFQAAPAKVAVFRRTIVNKQTNPHPRKSVFGVTSTDFLGWWQHWARSQVREEPSLTERSRWPGRPRQRGALEEWKGSGAERERHICCTAGRSVWSRHCGPLQSWRGERVRRL